VSEFDRTALRLYPLSTRQNRVSITSDAINPDEPSQADLRIETQDGIEELAQKIMEARRRNAPRVLAFGAHAVKNGLGPVLIRLIQEGWITLLATNGAGIIHDWEIAYQGETSEDVRENTAAGRFGLWDETGRYVNLALAVGAWRGLGYGESVGALTAENGLEIPAEDKLKREIFRNLDHNPAQAAAASDLLDLVQRFSLKPGWLSIPHPFAQYGVQAAAYRLGIPYTGHPMFGHDIIYTHPMNLGSAVGRTAERDFLRFAGEIQRIENGVYLSVGSAVMSPMIFEKSFSMAMNLAAQDGGAITNHYLCIVDLAESTWDWSRGEPPIEDPAYYMRFLKTFSRMGGTMRYLYGDNRDILLHLYQILRKESG
jgi:hypothetical protein